MTRDEVLKLAREVQSGAYYATPRVRDFARHVLELGRAVLELHAENERLLEENAKLTNIPDDAVYRSMSEGKRLVIMLKAARDRAIAERDALHREIDEAPTVYASFDGDVAGYSPWDTTHLRSGTHRAKLVRVTPIPVQSKSDAEEGA